jgi:CheY-like chemotaxis protein
MDAPEVLARVRSSPPLRDMPILVLTQAHWAEDEQAAVAAGATTFCAKPSSIGELRRVIERFWARARR